MPRPVEQQGNLRTGFRRLKRRRAWTLEKKIEYADRLLKRVLKKHDRPVVCWSGGKDSTVLLHLALRHNPEIDVLFNDTGVEFPETRQFVDQIVEDWGIVNFHLAKPERGEGFWDVTKQYGWPILGKEQSDNIERGRRRLRARVEEGELQEPETRIPLSGCSGQSNSSYLDNVEGFEKLSGMERVLVSYDVDISTRCCRFLKEKPTKKVEARLGVDCKILGIMASESRRRSLLWIDHGEYYYVKRYYTHTKGIWKALPMAIWTEDDIWEYHERYDVPSCSLYDMGYDRNGCWTCGMGVKFGHFGRLRQSHPKLFRFLMLRTEMGQQLLRTKMVLNGTQQDLDALGKWVDDIDMKVLLSQRPCFFDKL